MAGIFTTDKTRRQHAHLGPSRVDRLPAMLLKSDRELKGDSPSSTRTRPLGRMALKSDRELKGDSPLAPRVVLERLVVQLALPRGD
jgi:DNA polymerase-3 subunit delta